MTSTEVGCSGTFKICNRVAICFTVITAKISNFFVVSFFHRNDSETFQKSAAGACYCDDDNDDDGGMIKIYLYSKCEESLLFAEGPIR